MAYSEHQLSGLIESVVFYADDTGFCVLKIKNKQKKEPITVLGHTALVNVGEYLEATGHWVTNRGYGQQFKADTLTLKVPESLEGLEKYLGSGLIKDIGPHCC